MIEFPAGKLEPGEDRLVCARRELKEETGYSAREWARAGVIHPVISYSTEFIEIWFARSLTLGERQLDAGEFLDVITATPDELAQWCRDGRVTDAKTVAGMLWVQNVLSGAWPLDWMAPEATEAVIAMKVLDLQCAHHHAFEGWFASEHDFQSQLARGLVACPMCDDTAVTKLLSAPRLNLGASDTVKSPVAEPVAAGPSAARRVVEDGAPRHGPHRRCRRAISPRWPARCTTAKPGTKYPRQGDARGNRGPDRRGDRGAAVAAAGCPQGDASVDRGCRPLGQPQVVNCSAARRA